MGRGDRQKSDFYIIYAQETGSTFATGLASQLRSLVPKAAKLELDLEEPGKRRQRAQSPPSETEEETEVKRVLGASWLVILITPGIFECPICIREAALGLVHWKPIVMVQHLRSCPFIWRELELAPAPLKHAVETAMSHRTQPVCPFLPEYADLAAMFLLDLHPRLRPFTPDRRQDDPPGPEAIGGADLQKALQLVEGRIGLVYGTLGQDIAEALRHSLARGIKRLRVYDIRVDGQDEEDESSHPLLIRSIPSGKLPRMSFSRGLMRTWSDSFLPPITNDPTEKVPPPSIESSVSILFLIVSHGVLASSKALEAIEASWTKKSNARLVVLQDVRSVHSMTAEMKACMVPRHIRARLLASFCIPFVFKFGALAVVERMVRLQVLPTRTSGTQPQASRGPDVFLLHTLPSEADWAHLLRQEMQKRAPKIGCFLDIDENRDSQFLMELAANAKVIGMLASPGFIGNSWVAQILDMTRRRDVRPICIQALHLSFDLEAEVQQAAERLVRPIDITQGASQTALQDKRRRKRQQLNAMLKRMPLLAFLLPGSAVAEATAHLADLNKSIDMVACGVPATLRFLEATQDVDLVHTGLCALANFGLFGSDEDAALAVEHVAASQISRCLCDFHDNINVAVQGLRALVNFGLSNAGPAFLQQVAKEGCLPAIDQVADAHAAKSIDVRKHLCALNFAFGRYHDTKKCLEKSTWTELCSGWMAELQDMDDDKLAQLQAAVNLREALATAFDKAPPKGFSNALEAPGVMRNLIAAHDGFRIFEEADPNLWRRASMTEVPCMKFCGWHGHLKDHQRHKCTRKNAKVVPTESPSLQEAIDTTGRIGAVRASVLAAEGTREDPRPIIWIRPGTYTGGVTIDKPLRLMNDGASKECIIEAKDKSAVTFVSGCQAAQLHGLTVRTVGSKKAPAVSILSGTPGLHSCYISCENPQSSGVYVSGDSSEGRFWPQLVQNVISKCPGYGISFGGEARASVMDNDICENCLGGIHVANLAAPTLSSNRICDNKGFGIMVDRGEVQKKSNASALVESNTIARNGAEGVALGKASIAELRKNVIEGNTCQGIVVQGKMHIEQNVVMRNQKMGIELFETAEAEISKNRINSNEGYGIWARAGACGSITSNQVLENAKSQIFYAPEANPDLEVAVDNITEAAPEAAEGTTSSLLQIPAAQEGNDDLATTPRRDRRPGISPRM